VRSALAVLAAALVVASTGCSENKQGAATTAATTQAATTAAPPPTAPVNDWARKADTICARYQKQIDAIPPPASEEQAAATLERALVPIRRQERALKKLGPPEANPTIGLAFIGSIVSARKALEQVLQGLRANDEAKVTDGYSKAGAAGARTRSYAVQLGLVHCGAKRDMSG